MGITTKLYEVGTYILLYHHTDNIYIGKVVRVNKKSRTMVIFWPQLRSETDIEVGFDYSWMQSVEVMYIDEAIINILIAST